MYHKISSEIGDALTVTTVQLEAQMKWLIEEGYEFVTGTEVLAAVKAGETQTLPSRSVLITFDDAYLDNHELAFPLLAKFALPSVLFVPTAFIGQTSSWDYDASQLMSAEQLRAVAEGGVELGLHSHHHVSYSALTTKLIAKDVQSCVDTMGELGLPYLPVLAYPYGRRPNKKSERLAMVEVLEKIGIEMAFRIGNRVNPLPLSAPYEINRLGVRGDESMADFQQKIRRGRWF